MAIIDSKGRPLSRPKRARRSAGAPPVLDAQRLQLVELVTAAVKADRKQFGRPDYGRIAAAILPALDASQLGLLRTGAFGDAMARAVLRIEQKQR
jgi:hypothetical protein